VGVELGAHVKRRIWAEDAEKGIWARLGGKNNSRMEKTAQQVSSDLLPIYSRILLDKLTDSQLAKKFPAFYGNRRFITALTSARHLYLS
jgi:hypothetical protein